MGLADDIINGNYSYNKSKKNRKNNQILSKNYSLADDIINGTYKNNNKSQTLEIDEYENDTSLIDNIQNFASETGKVANNFWQGMKNGILSFQQTIGRAANDTQAQQIDLNNQMYKKALEGRLKDNPEEVAQINEAINNPLISGEQIKSESEEYYKKIQKKKDENTLKIQQNTESMSTEVGKYIAGEISPSIGQMAPGLIGGPTYFVGSATGNYYDDALQRGMTEKEAIMYSGTMGMIEGLLESLGTKLTKNVGKQLLKKNIKGALLDYGLDIGENFIEESIVEPISELSAQVFTGKDKANWDGIEQRMISSGVAGAITSAITGGVSGAIGTFRGNNHTSNKNVKTNNEQKVYDNEVKTRKNEKIRQSTIEQTYNEQIKTRQNLGVEITEDLKNEIRQKVEQAYDNGNLKNVELNKKDLLNIDEQVDKDFEDGNISAESIMNTLGENQDISKDNLLMRSMYENEQKYNSYQVERTVNEKVNILMQSATDAGMNNTKITRKKVELISKLVKDTDRQYKFVSPEQLKQLGYNENANGLINKTTGEILINVQTNKGIEAIVGHETTHMFDSKDEQGNYSKEYQALQDMAIEYAKVKGIYDSKVKSITEAYGDLLTDETQIREELTADLVGDFLFNDEKFIEKLAIKDRNIFQKIYDYIKHTYKMMKGTDEEKAFENLKNKFEKVYSTIVAETNTDIKYSMGGIKGLQNMKDYQKQFKLFEQYNEAKKMAKDGKSNKEMWKKTHWIKDSTTEELKFYFSDKDMDIYNKNYIIGKEYKLKDMLKHETLFEIYPELKDYTVIIEDMNTKRKDGTAKGSYNRYTDVIKLDYKRFNEKSDVEGTLIHEIQHAIQKIENFSRGASTEWGKKFYKNSPGEIEARESTERLMLEKYDKRNLDNVIPESAKIKLSILDKMKISLYNYIKDAKHGGENNDIETNNEENNKKDSDNISGYIQNGTRRILNSENSNKSSFPFEEHINIKNSLTNDTGITGDDIAVREMLVQKRPSLEEELGSFKEAEEVHVETEKTNKPYNAQDLAEKYKLMEIGKRQYEKLLRQTKPTEKELITVDRLLKGEIENNEIPMSVDRQRVIDLYNAKVKFYNTEKEIKLQRKEVVKDFRNLAKNMTQNISNWKDKKRGMQYQVNTMKRNLRDIIPNKNEADAVYKEYFQPVTKNNAVIEKEINQYNERIAKYEINNIESQYIQMIGENKYNPDTKLPIEKITDFYNENKNKIDVDKCNKAVEEFRNIYDELILEINDVLVENGYKPIEYRKGYFPHFIEDKAETLIGKFAEKLGWKVNKDTLPTDIAGITEQFRPGKRWTSFSQQRKSDDTDYNALKGYDNYIRGAMDVIHHTKDIQKLRALENEIRYQYSEKGIQEKIDSVYNETDIDIEEKQKKIEEIYDNVRNNPMGNLATEIRNYTNNLANKKASSDRGMEDFMSRSTYSVMTNIQNRVSANMVGANISSAITNFIPITQAWSQTSTKNTMRAIKEGIAIQFKDDGFADSSTFLTNRTQQADRLYKTGLDKVNDKLGYMFDVVDSFTSNVIVRAKYYDNIEAGMKTTEALDNADEFAKDVIAGRSKGDMPTVFNKKNPLIKLFTAFQLEVNNQYGYMLKDLPNNFGDEAKEKLVGAFVKMFLGAFLYNMISEKITGNKSAFSPIDIALDSYNTVTNDDISTGDKIQAIGEDLIGEIPFIGGVAGGGRLPIQGAIPYDDPASMFLETTSNVFELFDGDEEQKQTAIKSLTKEWSKPLYYVGLPFAGGQLKKSVEGISMYLNDVPGSYTNSGDLRFTVDDDIGSKVKATIFGTYANPYAQDYIESGFKSISKNNIDEMVGLDMNSSEYRQYKQGLNKSNKTEEKLNYINSLDLTDAQKNIAANNLNKDSKKTIDMSVYGDYSSYDEYKYARDYPNKHSVITQITSYDDFVEYKDKISDIKEQYNTEEGYSSAERKEAVRSYINNLDLNMYQKMMLEKMAGGYSIKQYKDYIQEYLDSENLSNAEKYTIWEELFS